MQEDSLTSFDLNGLTNEEVNKRYNLGLVNKISKKKTKTISEIYIENIFSLFNFIIFGIIIGVLYFYFRSNDIRLLYDTIGVLSVAFINTFIAIFQEIKAKRALDSVNLLLKKQITVIRDGNNTIINQEDVVSGDLIKLGRGEQIVVDGIVIYSNHLEIDESLLTGESIPLAKKENDYLLSGSFCISGNGLYKAEKIGNESYASSITDLAKKYKFSLTPLQKHLNLIVKVLFVTAIFLVLLEIIFNKYSNLNNIDFIRKSATILMSLIPQGLILMSSVTFSLGIFRISKLGAIIQKLNAVESFSNVQVVCMDKTGTLTKNKLVVEKLITIKESKTFEGFELLKYFTDKTSDKNATVVSIQQYLGNKITNLFYDNSITVIDEIPFSSDNKLSCILIENNNLKKGLIIGGYDVLFHHIKDESIKNICTNSFETNELKYYRNLLFAEIINLDGFKNDYEYVRNIIINPVSIISISDEIREDILDAINLFLSNGINIKILSGDAEYAIQSIVNKLGWIIPDYKMTNGNEIDKIESENFSDFIQSKIIYARLKPDHKLKIIKSLKKSGFYTAMIGDGVNDLPAIKEANMGIAMEEGSQITKEIADIVLLKNRFALLPNIFNEGNKIVNTVSSIAKLFLTKNFSVIFLSLLSLIFNLNFPITPRRVSLINIFTIGLPAFIIALKNKNTAKNLKFTVDLFTFVIISAGILTFAGYFSNYLISKYFILSTSDIEMIILTSLIITSISNFLSVADTKNNPDIFTYILYSLIIGSIYLSVSFINYNTGVIGIIKEFYEIKNINSLYLILTVILSLLFSAGLYLTQKLRGKIIQKY
jgi:cation-transporting P-type ATPase E